MPDGSETSLAIKESQPMEGASSMKYLLIASRRVASGFRSPRIPSGVTGDSLCGCQPDSDKTGDNLLRRPGARSLEGAA